MRYNDRSQLIETIFADDTPKDLNDNEHTINLYDRGDRLRASVIQVGNVTHYVYDALNRLIETIYLDEGDTLQQLLDAIAPTETLSQNGTVIDTTLYTYDDNGNLIQQVKNGTDTTTYTWNDDNRLVAVTLPDDCINISILMPIQSMEMKA